jgi:hypothetical protein
MKKNIFCLSIVMLIAGLTNAIPLQAASTAGTGVPADDRITIMHSYYAKFIRAAWEIVRPNTTPETLQPAFNAQKDPLLKMAIRMLCHQHYGANIDDMPLKEILMQRADTTTTTLDFSFIPVDSINRNETIQMIIGFTCMFIDIRSARPGCPSHMLIIKGLAGYNPTIVSEHITTLIAQDNQLTSLAGLHMPALNNLRISNNMLTSLDGVNVVALTCLDVRDNPIADEPSLAPVAQVPATAPQQPHPGPVDHERPAQVGCFSGCCIS